MELLQNLGFACKIPLWPVWIVSWHPYMVFLQTASQSRIAYRAIWTHFVAKYEIVSLNEPANRSSPRYSYVKTVFQSQSRKLVEIVLIWQYDLPLWKAISKSILCVKEESRELERVSPRVDYQKGPTLYPTLSFKTKMTFTIEDSSSYLWMILRGI